MTEPKRMDIAEFRKLGYLQEANRLFFHPLGLELQLSLATNQLSVMDYRSHPNRPLIADVTASETLQKAQFVAAERSNRPGYDTGWPSDVQPIPGLEPVKFQSPHAPTGDMEITKQTLAADRPNPSLAAAIQEQERIDAAIMKGDGAENPPVGTLQPTKKGGRDFTPKR